jgi:glycine/D-amino acid oxidase-like deaminating enzyme/nitrite reductase/ring-hydroxylating ferredoxin subunit
MNGTESLWVSSAPVRPRPALEPDTKTGALVVGAGITGLVTALLLQRDGHEVTVIDQHGVAEGVTGYTTGKISSLHQVVYSELAGRFGADGARTYALANEAGLARIAELVDELRMECDFRRRPNYTYAASDEEAGAVADEAKAAAEAGLDVTLENDVPLPFPTAGAVRLGNQAEFHPVKFLAALADELENAGARIFERTRAVSVRDGTPCDVDTTGGRITAEHVVLATHFPFPDRGLFFARVHAERSYCVAAPLAGAALDGMFISAGSPTRSLRCQPDGGGELLIVGGESHTVGRGGHTAPRYAALEAFARQHFEIGEVSHRWSAQDNYSADGAPLVGKLTPRSRRTHVATGFRKWGLAMGAAAAELIADAVAGRENPWQSFFDATRIPPLGSAKALAEQNAGTGFHFFADRLTRRGRDEAEDLAPGEGRIASRQGRQVAISRDDDGVVHAVSARCTHLGCIVSWNDAERTWDCPCHASRFSPDGSVLQGPAVHPLAPRPAP